MLAVLAHIGQGTESGQVWQGMMGPGMMGWGMMGTPGGWFWLWSLLTWLIWILIIVALIAAIRWLWKMGGK